MRFAAVLNRDGGTLRTLDLDAFSATIHETVESAGHEVDIDIVAGDRLVAAIDKAASGASDVVLVGGGDGTVSAAAARLMNQEKALAILPAGTMNLFARSLGIPLDLQLAVQSFATGKVQAVDIATANGRPFVHQFSIGMHAKMVHLRESMDFASRLGKIRASCRAAYDTLLDPPAMHVALTIDEAEIRTRSSAIGVSNNLFGEGHLPYADRPDGGVLGVYVTIARTKGELLRFFINMARGKWRDNDQVEIHQARRVVVKTLSRRRKLRCTIDGELCELEPETEIVIHPGALRVLVPDKEAQAEAA